MEERISEWRPRAPSPARSSPAAAPRRPRPARSRSVACRRGKSRRAGGRCCGRRARAWHRSRSNPDGRCSSPCRPRTPRRTRCSEWSYGSGNTERRTERPPECCVRRRRRPYCCSRRAPSIRTEWTRLKPANCSESSVRRRDSIYVRKWNEWMPLPRVENGARSVNLLNVANSSGDEHTLEVRENIGGNNAILRVGSLLQAKPGILLVMVKNSKNIHTLLCRRNGVGNHIWRSLLRFHTVPFWIVFIYPSKTYLKGTGLRSTRNRGTNTALALLKRFRCQELCVFKRG